MTITFTTLTQEGLQNEVTENVTSMRLIFCLQLNIWLLDSSFSPIKPCDISTSLLRRARSTSFFLPDMQNTSHVCSHLPGMMRFISLCPTFWSPVTVRSVLSFCWKRIYDIVKIFDSENLLRKEQQYLEFLWKSLYKSYINVLCFTHW